MGSSGRTRGPRGEAAGAPRPSSAPPPELSPAPRLRAHKMDQATVRRAGCKYLKSLSRAGGNGFRSRNVCWEKRGRAMRVLCCEMGELFLFLPPPALVRGGLQVPASRFPALRSLPPRPTIVFENANR